MRSSADSSIDQQSTAPGPLTPVSLSSGSPSVSPKTPNGTTNTGRADDYFGPRIATDSPPPQQMTSGGYGGFGDADIHESPVVSTSSPMKQSSSLLQRMNTMANQHLPDLSSGLGSMKVPKAPWKTGYGGFGPPKKEVDESERDLRSPARADTFPELSGNWAAPARAPSAPSPRAESTRRPSQGSQVLGRRPSMATDRTRRPSMGPDTSRPPPPRSSLVRPRTRDDNKPSMVNLEDEFGAGNPFYTTSDFVSSNGSRSSQSAAANSRSSSQSHTSPQKSRGSQVARKPSEKSSFGNIMSDLQASEEEFRPKELKSIAIPPPYAGRDKNHPLSPIGRRPPRPDWGYDPRIDPAIQNPRGTYVRSPLASPSLAQTLAFARRDDPAVQRPSAIPPVPASDPARIPSPPPIPSTERAGIQNETRSRSRSQSVPREPSRTGSQSRPKNAAGHSSRGDCKACRLPITGKSISSADGRLTGRYHKACFVCNTCQEPFSSAVFYVLDDQPYCGRHYHKLNGSLCGSCGNGIEGQYLEDESSKKHHVGCFRCHDCGIALEDGYFEVDGIALCERDAWRRTQPYGRQNSVGSMGYVGARDRSRGLGPGGPVPRVPSNLAPGPRMEKRMTRLLMMGA